MDGLDLNRCMRKMTKYQLNHKINQEEKTVEFTDYPELGILKLEGERREELYREFWNRWYRNGKYPNKQRFEKRYNEYEEFKSINPENEVGINYIKRKILKLGVSVLPLIMQKIEQDQTGLIPLVAELTSNEVNRDTTVDDVLSWWKQNKEKWIIFDYQVDY